MTKKAECARFRHCNAEEDGYRFPCRREIRYPKCDTHSDAMESTSPPPPQNLMLRSIRRRGNGNKLRLSRFKEGETGEDNSN